MPTPSVKRRSPRYSPAGIQLPRDIDGRTKESRRFIALVSAFEAELGPPLTEPDKALVRQVCSLQLRVEQLQSAIIAGRDVSADEIIRLSSEHRRVLTTLRAKAAANKPAGATALQDYLARKAEQAADALEASK